MKFFFALIVSLIFFGIVIDCARYTDPVRVYGKFSKYQGGLVLEPHDSLDSIDCENRHPGSLFVLRAGGDQTRTHLVYCDADGKTPRLYGIEQQPAFGFSQGVVAIPELFQDGETVASTETTQIELRYEKWQEEANQACVDTWGEQARAGKATEFALFWNTGVGRGKDLRFTGSNPNYLAVTADGAVIVNHEHKEYGYPILAVFADRRNGFGHEWDCDANGVCTQIAFSPYDSTTLEDSLVSEFPDEYEHNAHVFCVASTAQKQGVSVAHDEDCLDTTGDLAVLQSNLDLISRYYAGWVDADALPSWYDDVSTFDFNFIHGVGNSDEFSGNYEYELEMDIGSSREPWHRNKVENPSHTYSVGYAYSINEDCRKAPEYNCTDFNYVYDFASPYSQFFGYDILGSEVYFRVEQDNFQDFCCPNGLWELGIDRHLNNSANNPINTNPDEDFNHISNLGSNWKMLTPENNVPLIRRTDRSFDMIRYTINGKVSLRCEDDVGLRRQQRCGSVKLHMQIRSKPFDGAKILHKTCESHNSYTNDKLCNNYIPSPETTADWNCESHNEFD